MEIEVKFTSIPFLWVARKSEKIQDRTIEFDPGSDW